MKYSILKEHAANLSVVQIDEGEFQGCQLIYGPVSFDGDPEADEHVKLKFDYSIVNNYTVSKDRMDALVNVIGDVLTDILIEDLDEGRTIFTGGT